MAEQSAADRAAYGGQAVIEGVMIRGKTRVATACRLSDGSITVRHDDADSMLRRYKWLRWPVLRGTPALVDSFSLGYRTLMWSADQALAEGEQPQKLSSTQQFLTILFSVVFAVALFRLLPSAAVTLVTAKAPAIAHLLHLHVAAPIAAPAPTGPVSFWAQFVPTRATVVKNLLEGAIVLLLLVSYILFIRRSKEVRRIFAYHGAEHKVVNGYEGGAALSVDAVRGYSRIHPRCGTSFLFLFVVASIVTHALIGWPHALLLLLASRIVLIPIVAGLAYELIRLSGRFRNATLTYFFIWPGLLLQRLTTAEPEDAQIEVALAALRGVLTDEGVLPAEPDPAPAA